MLVAAARARCHSDWKCLRLDRHDDLFNTAEDERERADYDGVQPERLERFPCAWLKWNETMPPIPDDATVSLGYSAKDTPQR